MLAGERMTTLIDPRPTLKGPTSRRPNSRSSDRVVKTSTYSVVVIGASAGGISALMSLLAFLPTDFALPILVVQHLPAKLRSNLPTILGWRTALRVKWAQDREPMGPGTVYVAPPDQHLLVGAGGRLSLSSSAPVGLWRPAVDALFESAAQFCGDRAIAIVLSGAMWDGAKGIAAVAERGGITIAQDEASSDWFDMPAAALDLGHADIMMAPPKIAEALLLLVEGRSLPSEQSSTKLGAGGASS
jgi:two-component system chemotaxis response regulator CheB